MRAATLMACIIALSASTVKDVRGSNTVSSAKLERWTKNKNIDGSKVGVEKSEIRNSVKDATGKPEELSDLLEVIQYIIIDALNNSEYRSFMIKRFLHNYVRQASEYLDNIKALKKKMNPEEAKADEKKDKSMKNH